MASKWPDEQAEAKLLQYCRLAQYEVVNTDGGDMPLQLARKVIERIRQLEAVRDQLLACLKEANTKMFFAEHAQAIARAEET